MAPRFVIVGTGRSGSSYISALLTAAGIQCGAESWWNPWNTHDDTIVGDSSCCALPMGLDDYDGLVFHQLRHPLDVVTSFWYAPIRDPHLTLFRRLVSTDPGDSLSFAMSTWLSFAHEAERHAVRWWRLDQVDPALVRSVGEDLGIAARFPENPPPTTINRHYLEGSRLTWADLRKHDSALTAELVDCAKRYGFEGRD